MTRSMRTVHKWVTLVLALQFVAWMTSGLALSLLDHDAVAGHYHRRTTESATRTWPTGLLSPGNVMTNAGERVQRIETAWLLDRPVYKLSNDQRTWLVDAATGRPATVDRSAARTIATGDYEGPVQASEPEWLTEVPREAIDHGAPLWRVRFADEDDTSLYVSPVDGQILERRNVQSRWYDVFWSLHTMDYSGRGEFNHPLVVASAASGLLAALTGAWLLVVSLQRRRVRSKVAA